MKQGEKIVFHVSDGAAVILERSDRKLVKLPTLTIMLPDRYDGGTGDTIVERAKSIILFNEGVRELYEGLKKYHEDDER